MMGWWHRWRERWRARLGREIMHQNAYLSREDGYRYPRCDIKGEVSNEHFQDRQEDQGL